MMKSFFKKLAFVMALAMVVSLAAPAATTAAAADAIQIKYQNGVDTPSEINLTKVGATEDLKFTGAPDYKEAGFEWTSSNPAVATVDQTGLVTAVAAGTAEVTVKVGTDREDTVKVNVVDLPTYTATMGTSSKDLKTEVALEVGDEIDFGFFGIKDYDRNRYQCNWFEAGNGSVATVDKNGVIKAIGEGTTVISLGVYNVVTGMKHSVASCTVTVGAKATPVPAQSVAVKGGFNTTEKSLELEFTGFNTDIFKDNHKEYIEIYEVFDGETVDQEYIWQINKVSVDKDNKNIVKVEGYATHELTDGSDYVVRILDKDGEVVLETEFTASVGAVVKVAPYFGSYRNNQWNSVQFWGEAYTNCGSGEDIYTYIFYDLYDANGVNVTGHYHRAYGETDLITLDVITEDVDYCMDLYENGNYILFTDIPEVPVRINVEYNDYNNGEPVEAPLTMVVKEAPAYRVTSIDKWNIVLTSGASVSASDTQNKQDVALFDDYDVATGTELKNHEIVLWITDNYGNKWVTNDSYDNWEILGGRYDKIAESEKFTSEGFELRYETRNPQVLVVGDDETIDGEVNSSVITTKKVGTASINVTLHDAYAEELLTRIDVLKVNVKAARYVKSVTANNISVLTDSKSEGMDTTSEHYRNDNNDTAAGSKQDVEHYDGRFTNNTVKVYVKDQYNEAWGIYNNSAATSIDVSAVSTNDAVAVINHGDWTADWDTPYTMKFFGPDLLADLDSVKTSSVSYKVTVVDALNDFAEKTTSFRVSLNYPTKDKDTLDIQTKSKLVLSAKDTTYTTAKNLKTSITVIEQSTNGYNVNYADGISLITNSTDHASVFSKTEYTYGGQTLTKGSMFIEVYDPQGKLVKNTAEGTNEIGVKQVESGLYEFIIAEDYDAAKAILFTTAGSYTVKLYEVTGIKVVDGKDTIGTYKTFTTKFTVKKDFPEIDVTNQDQIFLDYEYFTKAEVTPSALTIADQALSFTADVNKGTWSAYSFYVGIYGVRYRQNTRDNTIVIQDVFVKTLHDTNQNGKNTGDSGAYYFVEVPVDMTVSLEDLDMLNNVDSVKANKNPEGDKMQK